MYGQPYGRGCDPRGVRRPLALLLAGAAALVGATGSQASHPSGPVGQSAAERAAPREAFPARRNIAAARRFVRRRASSSLALIDTRGRFHGFAARRRYISASVSKAMMLVAYLRKIGPRRPNAGERALLGPMITMSDNDRADAIYARVGDGGLLAVARRARMRDVTVAGHWGSVFFSARDQARFFFRLPSMVPRRSRGYARRLLSSIIPAQRWGFSRVSSHRGWRAFFKGGWRQTDSGSLVHEVAFFERGSRRFSLAVLTDGNPSHAYGTATLRGVARRLFARRRPRAATRGGLVDVRRFAPGLTVDLVYRTDHNLTGRRLPGYCRNQALMLEPAARDLARVQRRLRRRGLGLLVLEAYRPARASRALVRWAQRIGRGDLVGTYIARRSRHNTGSAVDLTLVRASDGRRLRMGSGYDDLGRRAHTRNARGNVLRNRLLLKRAMERFGFSGYWREWWHFEHRATSARYLDFPLGCRSHPR
jgi:D-alanyl-D-alanine dipeptidase